MHHLPPLSQIPVPGPRPDEVYSGQCFNRQVTFRGLKQLLGAADVSKAGDRHAGLAAAGETLREAARAILSDLTLQHLYDHPLTDDNGRIRYRTSIRWANRELQDGFSAAVVELVLAAHPSAFVGALP